MFLKETCSSEKYAIYEIICSVKGAFFRIASNDGNYIIVKLTFFDMECHSIKFTYYIYILDTNNIVEFVPIL